MRVAKLTSAVEDGSDLERGCYFYCISLEKTWTCDLSGFRGTLQCNVVNITCFPLAVLKKSS